MNSKMIRAVGAALVVAIWLGLTAFAWFGPTQERSAAEKRPLAQFPEVSLDAIFGTDENGEHPFMAGFEDYALDQFPVRDGLRSLKAIFHTYVLGVRDNNGYYYKDGYLAVQDAVLDQTAIDNKLDVLNQVYEKLLAGSGGRFYLSMVPDKSYYLAEKYGYPSLDYQALEEQLKQSLSWAEYVDITGTLELGDFYRTDTHWRQENLIPTAQALAQAMGVNGPKEEDYTAVKVDKPFYGVYHAQAALPVAPDDMYVLESGVFEGLTITVDGAAKTDVYDMTKLDSDDQYNIFLSGAKTGMVTIENPNAATDRHLVIFRDSFGSAIAPLFIGDYAQITLIDLRVISTSAVSMLVDFQDADVLVLLSALALNNGDEAFIG